MKRLRNNNYRKELDFKNFKKKNIDSVKRYSELLVNTVKELPKASPPAKDKKRKYKGWICIAFYIYDDVMYWSENLKYKFLLLRINFICTVHAYNDIESFNIKRTLLKNITLYYSWYKLSKRRWILLSSRSIGRTVQY